MSSFSDFLPLLSQYFSTNPSVLLMQIATILVAAIVIFLVLFGAKDILSRTDSFLAQIFCVLLIALLPLIGFFLYLLLRPSTRTIERKILRELRVMSHQKAKQQVPQIKQQPQSPQQSKKHQHEKSKK